MKIWQFTFGSQNAVASLVYADHDEMRSGMFDGAGKPLVWAQRPHVQVFIEPRKKKPKPRVDISALRPGTLVLNAKAKEVLGPFLLNFGQLLELDCGGAVEHFYNVTNVIDCIDSEKSDRWPEGTIAKEFFFEHKLPTAPTLFKDPRTARVRIYANEAAKSVLEDLIAEAGITGAMFAELGPPPSRPRPTS